MMDTKRILSELPSRQFSGADLGAEPTRADIRKEVQRLKKEGLCGRRIGQQHLGPYFVANGRYGQREIDLLEDVLEEEYAATDLCVRKRGSECSRLRGGCKNYR